MVLTDFSSLRLSYDPAVVLVDHKPPPPLASSDPISSPMHDSDSVLAPFTTTTTIEYDSVVEASPKSMASHHRTTTMTTTMTTMVSTHSPTTSCALTIATTSRHPATTMIPRLMSDGELSTRAGREKTANRFKSYSDNGPALTRMAAAKSKARPYSAGDVEDLRRVQISGFSKNKNGIWMFKVDIGTDDLDSYAVRRRFSDFKELHEGLLLMGAPEQLPRLPEHGMFSVMQMFFSPEPILSERAKRLEELLQFINQHPLLSVSAPFIKFIGKNPLSLEVGYVSLSCYEAPTSEGFAPRLSGSRPRARLMST